MKSTLESIFFKEEEDDRCISMIFHTLAEIDGLNDSLNVPIVNTPRMKSGCLEEKLFLHEVDGTTEVFRSRDARPLASIVNSRRRMKVTRGSTMVLGNPCESTIRFSLASSNATLPFRSEQSVLLTPNFLARDQHSSFATIAQISNVILWNDLVDSSLHRTL
ncbi:hypothetical protein KM043_010716 [Ampulex compressa]|nr:hypothetical protein KM043_010716 [Ampulex compressa]